MATELKTPNAPKFYQLVSPAKQTNQTSWAVPQIKKKPVDNLESYIPERWVDISSVLFRETP